MKILFTSDCNGHEYKDPRAFLIETTDISDEVLHSADMKTSNRFHGGIAEHILKSLGVEFQELKRGKFSEFSREEYDKEFKLSSGNY